MTEPIIRAIEAALAKGLRVELTQDRGGQIKVRTVVRKELKISDCTHARNGGREGPNGVNC